MIKKDVLTTIVHNFIVDKKSVVILANSNDSAMYLGSVLNKANIRHGLLGVVIDGEFSDPEKYRCQIIPYQKFPAIIKKHGFEYPDIIIRETQSNQSFLISGS